MTNALIAFLKESNQIEGILRGPTEEELLRVESFLSLRSLSLADLKDLQCAFAPGKPFRDKVGMDVRVGSSVPPRGGTEIVERIENLLLVAQIADADPWVIHCTFEHIHPFMDGNGRTGRVLWAWMMRRNGCDPFALPFLHRFYYQTLSSVAPKLALGDPIKGTMQ
jgi:hypothetical protein